MTDPVDFLNRAAEIAPVPEADDDAFEWVRHYACQAMAANAAFRSLMGGDRAAELAYLSMLGTAATAATVALSMPDETAARMIWELTPEAGALNGEWVDHLADVLVAQDINPADLYPWFNPDDFDAPLRLPKVEVA
jgi:hypothetical protein